MISVAEEFRQAADENAKASFVKVGLAKSQMETLKDWLIQNKSRLLELNNLLSEAEESKRVVAEKTKIKSLEEEAEKEKALSSETTKKCKALEEEITKLKEEAERRSQAEFQPAAGSKMGHKIKQEEELALAAGRFAEFRKTIALLCEKLICLALVDDFTVDPEDHLEPMDEGLQTQEAISEPFQKHYREIFPFKTDVPI